MNGASHSDSVDTLVLGGGLTGLTAAYHIGSRATIVEKLPHVGGTASTLHRDGFHLDRAVHVLAFRDRITHDWIADELGVPLDRRTREAGVWFQGQVVPYPIQFHLSHLPMLPRLRYTASAVFSRAMRVRSHDDGSLAARDSRHHGAALNRDFSTPYNRKLWSVTPDHIVAGWGDGYMPAPSLRRLVSGAISTRHQSVGHNATYCYPRAGGIGRIAEAIAQELHDVRLNMALEFLDYKRRVAKFANGQEIKYLDLVSTLPLPELIRALQPQIPQLSRCATTLRSNSLTIVHLMVPRANVGGALHWLYVPDTDLPFYRISFPHNICPSNCPKGWSVLTLECGSATPDSPAMRKRIVDGLLRMGMLTRDEFDVEMIWDALPYGYVICDEAWSRLRADALRLLRDHEIVSLGRYGRWEYSNMEAAILQGRSAPRRLSRSTVSARIEGSPSRTSPGSLRGYYAKRYLSRRFKTMRALLLRRGDADRLRVLRSWVPQWEGITVLDAGCGDATFLARALHGRPLGVRLEDLVEPRATGALELIRDLADTTEAIAVDIGTSNDSTRYEVVLALGVFDNATDWEHLIQCLARRSKGVLIADFPKSGTVHAAARRVWLGWHGIPLKATDRSGLEALLRSNHLNADILELPLQWMVRIHLNGVAST